MHIRDLQQFRDQVAMPRMMQLFENTPIPDGARYIDNLKVCFLDGNNCGYDFLIEASGLSYRNGKVEEYRFSELDVSFGEFLASHQDCLFVWDGDLVVSNELEKLELRARLCNRQECEKLFHFMKCPEEMRVDYEPIGFEKMKHLLKTQEKEAATEKLPPLGEAMGKAKDEATGKNASRREFPHRSGSREFDR